MDNGVTCSRQQQQLCDVITPASRFHPVFPHCVTELKTTSVGLTYFDTRMLVVILLLSRNPPELARVHVCMEVSSRHGYLLMLFVSKKGLDQVREDAKFKIFQIRSRRLINLSEPLSNDQAFPLCPFSHLVFIMPPPLTSSLGVQQWETLPWSFLSNIFLWESALPGFPSSVSPIIIHQYSLTGDGGLSVHPPRTRYSLTHLTLEPPLSITTPQIPPLVCFTIFLTIPPHVPSWTSSKLF